MSERILEELAYALGHSCPAEEGAAREQWDTDTFAVAAAIGDAEGRLRRKALQVFEAREGGVTR